MENQAIRVRFAPSPTGPLHMGGVRTALYNYLFARQTGGQFILRLEDTDQTRFVPGAENYIVESLKWCGIEIDEGISAGGPKGPYRQSERKAMYRQYADQMIESGHVYYAFDTPEELNAMRERMKAAGVPSPQYNHITREHMQNSLTLPHDEVAARIEKGDPYVIRIKMPRNEEVKFADLIRGWVSVNTNNLDDKVLFKSDGMPTYHLANIVDDHLMEISHVIRGEEWLPSAPLHVLLYRYLGWEMPQFAHLPLILKPDGNGKLSKRDGDRLGFPVFPLRWVPEEGDPSKGYREQGYFPGAFINMLAFLGWNPGTNEEIFSMDELMERFSLERVNKAGARFDPDKTRWFNQQYLRTKSDQELGALLQPLAAEEGFNATAEFCAQVASVMKERATFVKEMLTDGHYFFEAPTEYEEKALKRWKEDTAEIVKALRDLLDKVQDFSSAKVDEAFHGFMEDRGLGFGKVGPGFRLALTGKGMGPGLPDIAAIIGKEETLKRLDTALEKLS
ncbi:MAG: glutamate--tRNA ligase [Flavobacteriales bacterium]|nr:glutamate--tRNA ligase [Flavobacteriales bacterium]